LTSKSTKRIISFSKKNGIYLNDFKFFIYGGFSSSQRSRIACFRGDNIPEEDALKSNFPA